MKKVLIFIRSKKSKYISGIIGALSAILPIVVISIGQIVFPGHLDVQNIMVGFASILLFFLTGSIGLIFIIREEINGPFTIHGKLAKAIGITIIIISIVFLCYAVVITGEMIMNSLTI